MADELKPLVQQAVVDAVLAKLTKLGISKCPMCSNAAFSLVNGFIAPPLHESVNDLWALGGDKQVLPCVSIVCNRCGFMSTHALGPLGLTHLFQKGATNG